MKSGSRSRCKITCNMRDSCNLDLDLDVCTACEIRGIEIYQMQSNYMHWFVCLFVFKLKELWQMSAEAACHLAFRQSQAFFFFFPPANPLKDVLLQICLRPKGWWADLDPGKFETKIWLRFSPPPPCAVIFILSPCQSLTLRSKTAHCWDLWPLWPLRFLLSSRIELLFLAPPERRESVKEKDSFNFYNCFQSSPILG